MLRIIFLFCFTFLSVICQESENNEACGSHTTYQYYYYSKDVNPINGPTIQPQTNVLQGRPGKTGARGLKGNRGDKGEPGVPDRSVVLSLRNELTETKTRFDEMRNEVTEIRNELRDTKTQLSFLQSKTAFMTSDCNDNIETSGVYFKIDDGGIKAVYCEVDANNWLVIQRRVDDSVDFYRNWRDYQQGFGDVEGNYWIGLDTMHKITSSRSYQLHVELEDWDGNTAYAQYSSFIIGDETSNYRLNISGYSGSAGDSFAPVNNPQFSTKDRDNDRAPIPDLNCAVDRHGAWWYNYCSLSNLNGEYLRNQTSRRSIYWRGWRNFLALKRSEMKIKPN